MSVRHDWYQCDKYVTITVLFKNAGEKTHSIKIEPEKVEIIVEDYNLTLNLLHPIDEVKSVYKVLPSKIEIKLMKSLSERWDNLTKKEEAVTAVFKQKKPEDWEKLSKEIEKNEETERQVSLMKNSRCSNLMIINFVNRVRRHYRHYLRKFTQIPVRIPVKL